MKKPKLTSKQQEILDVFVRESRKVRRFLTLTEMKELGYTREKLRQSFSSLTNMKNVARAAYPKELSELIEENLFDHRRMVALKKELRKTKRFVVTTAVNNAAVHKGFLKSLKNFCKENKAMLLISPSGKDVDAMSPHLAEENWIFENMTLNSNVWISNIKINPNSAQPTTALSRIGQRDGSLIAASPKQFLQFVPVGNEKLPHAVMTTGAITVPNYSNPKTGRISKTDYLAEHDHVLGAIVVEVVSHKEYHFRQVQAAHDGSFHDLGKKYFPNRKSMKVAPIGMLWGDLHAGEVDLSAKTAALEQMSLLGVRRVFLGDAFGGISINHHEEKNLITRARLALKCKMSLEEEVRDFVKEINDISEKADEVIVVASNHHDFLNKYLEQAKYINEPHNFLFASKLATAMAEGHDPLEYASKTLIGFKHPSKVKFLKRDEDYMLAGVQMGQHGDKGANGSKGSKVTLETAYGKIMHGHTHSPYIFRGVYCVGTTSILRPEFVTGASSWVHCNGFVYPDGSCQLINSFSGKWRMK
jgi:hypothetical protein